MLPRNASTETSRSTPESDNPETAYSGDECVDQVAVVGMGCRVAGGINNPEQLWECLLNQTDASGTIPPLRWAAYHKRDPRNTLVLDNTTTRGYFLENLCDFDAQFFGISPREAEQMDPQQRISLEVAWEALEDAGITAECLSGTDTAVYWGVNSDDYSKHVLEDLPNIDAWMGIGTAYCGVPNRISYHLNLTGPSVAIDGACASSLVAVHQGVQAILAKESTVAIVGGVNALCSPGLFRVLDKAGALSSDGRCRSFDDGADGYGRGEGTGAAILKRLSQAVKDGDHIRAIIKGNTAAHDGKKNGIMAPNAEAQALVANRALRTGNVDPLTVQYVEAHATSTALGDPTEIGAISRVYGFGRQTERPCLIGSIKPNIGHLEAGAGVMGLIKTVLAIEKGVIPPQANLQKLNTRIDWEKAGIKVVQEITKWPSPYGKRRGAVCSYGYGGTLAHLVLEESPLLPELAERSLLCDTGSLHTLMVSGTQQKRLPVHASLLKNWILSDGSNNDLRAICSTLAVRRDHHDCRAALLVDSHKNAVEALENLANGSNDPRIVQGRVLPAEASRGVVWVFSGHGAQWTAMGKDLLECSRFYRAIEPLDQIVRTEIGLSPIYWLQTGEFASSDRVQILTYIMQVGLSAVLHDYGLYPQAIIGHSIGEVAATVVAGALSSTEGMLIVTRRAVLYRQVAGQGAMVMIDKPYGETSEYIKGKRNVVAAIEASPSSCVISGLTDSVATVAEEFRERGAKVFSVKTDIGFHSPMLGELIEPLLSSLEGILSPTRPATKLYSTSLADARGQDMRTAQYWASNMIKPVRFASAVHAAIDDGYRVFMEISSHPIVSHSLTESLLDCGFDDYNVVPTLRRDQSAAQSILRSMASLHCSGVSIDWELQMSSDWVTGMPTTPWMHRPIWREVETPLLGVPVTHDADQHTLLGQRIGVEGTEMVVYTTSLDSKTKPYPGSHPLFGTEIVPAAALVNTFLKATGGFALQDVILRVPVAITQPRDVQVIVENDQVRLVSRLVQSEGAEDCSWVIHTTSNWSSAADDVPEERLDIATIRDSIQTKLSDDFSLNYLINVGVSAMGYPWKVLEHYGNAEEMLTFVDVAPGTEDVGWDPSSWAPLLDAATSVGSTIFEEPRLRMPAHIRQVAVLSRQNPPKLGWLHVQKASDAPFSSHVHVLNKDGFIVAKFTSMRFSEIEGTSGLSRSMESLVHHLAWPPATPAEEPLRVKRVIFVGNESPAMSMYLNTLPDNILRLRVSAAQDFISKSSSLSTEEGTAAVYVPSEVGSLQNVAIEAGHFVWQILEIVKFVIHESLPVKVFILTSDAGQAPTLTALAHAPLVGLSRIIASEHPDVFGGLIDSDDLSFPLVTIKYIQGADVIRIRDGVARTARLRPLPRRLRIDQQPKMLPRPEGTYLVIGGLGALGLSAAGFLAEHGARRIVLVSRREFPRRDAWSDLPKDQEEISAKVLELERRGVCVHILSCDIADCHSPTYLLEALNSLSLPQVLGVVHAAGVLENEFVTETTQDAFARVLAPKIAGALNLHKAFPPGQLDFFVLFSSCGQLFGFPGQASYASGNAFLDSLATHRRHLGDNAVSFQWTAWRGIGMGANNEIVTAELANRGITDVTSEEAFGAWLHLSHYDIGHGIILRSRAFDPGEPLPTPILNDIAVRHASERSHTRSSSNATEDSAGRVPPSGADLERYLEAKIRESVAETLSLAPDEIDPKTALAELGLDSVLTVGLRRQLQQGLEINVPPTLIWNHPTINHLVRWYMEKMAKQTG